MNSRDTMKHLRDHRPAPRASRPDDDLLARVVSGPGDPRFGTSGGGRARRHHPRLIAGSSLGVAGIVAALVVAFGGGAAVSGGPAASSAFAITRQADGTVLVTLSGQGSLVPVDEQLVKMGIKEQVDYSTAAGPATSTAPVACSRVLGPGDSTPAPASAGPEVQMRVTNSSGTWVTGNSGSGSHTVHLANCFSYPEGPGTELGNSGQAFLKHDGG